MLAFFNQDRDVWGFWHDWYLEMWEGRFTGWKLAHEVAQIKNSAWQSGALAVAVEIEAIKARLVEEALPQVERIEFNAAI